MAAFRVTKWYKLNNRGERSYNHLEDGWSMTTYPMPVKPMYANQKAWSKDQWEKEHAYLTQEGKVIRRH